MAHTPASRVVRDLVGLLGVLLRRLLTPWHVPIDIPYNSWFRTIVLPIAAMEDGHLVAAISAISLAIATKNLDLCVQGLFGAGKSRTAAILLSGLVVSFPGHLQREYRHEKLCQSALVSRCCH